jgi:TolB protein
VVLLAAMLCALALPQSASAAFPGTNGKLAFVSPRNGFPTDSNLLTMTSTGASQTPVTAWNGDELYPSWSPDGAKLVFQYDNGTSPEIWTILSNGTGQVRLTNNTDGDRHPEWSPDGTQIVFASDRGAGTLNDLYVMNANGTGQTAITNTPDVDEDYPSWSPNGTKIVFSRDGDLATISPTGTGLVPLTATARMEIEPDWSPNQTQIVFRVGINADDDIYKMNADGSGVTNLTNTAPVVKEHPVWSPAGDKIAYVRGAFSGAEIWTMNADGSNKVQITSNAFLDMQPAWQPLPINTYPRPSGSRRRQYFSLVPAFTPCTSGNRNHGPPLSGPSCTPAVMTSPNLTTKSNWTGFLALKIIAGNPANGFDDAKVKFTSKVYGLYRKDTGRGYNKEIRFEVQVQMTDRTNTPHPGGSGAGTAQPITLAWTVPCFRETTDQFSQGICALSLKDDVLGPNLVPEGKRSIWEISQVRVYDGGADSDADTLADNRLLGTQGLFVP